VWGVALILFVLCAIDFYVQSFRRGKPILKNPHLPSLVAVILLLTVPLIWIALPYAYTHPGVMFTRIFLLIFVVFWWVRLLVPLTAWKTPLNRWEQIGMLLVCGSLTFLAMVLFLGKAPPIHAYDDAVIMSFGRDLFESGKFYSTFYPYRTSLDLAIGNSVLTWGLGAWMSIMGYSVESARLYFLLVSLPCLPFVFTVFAICLWLWSVAVRAGGGVGSHSNYSSAPVYNNLLTP
jgi:hypothetical protein